MKKIAVLTLSLFAAVSVFAQSSLEVSRNAQGQKILKGFIDKKALASDTAFVWYTQTLQGFTPAPDVVSKYSSNKDGISLVVFGGTWCGDTQHLLPKFFATTDAAGFPENHITLIGVDESKKTLFNLTEAFGVTNVPTIIVMKDGKEAGRVVEYGKIGAPEKEVADIIANAAAKKP